VRFLFGSFPAGSRNSVITTALIIERGVLAFVGFFDETCGEESFDGSVKCARADAHGALGRLGDIGHDAVTVAFAAGEAEEDMESGGWKRETGECGAA